LLSFICEDILSVLNNVEYFFKNLVLISIIIDTNFSKTSMFQIPSNFAKNGVREGGGAKIQEGGGCPPNPSTRHPHSNAPPTHPKHIYGLRSAVYPYRASISHKKFIPFLKIFFCFTLFTSHYSIIAYQPAATVLH
jgi:hypothetical protein